MPYKEHTHIEVGNMLLFNNVFKNGGDILMLTVCFATIPMKLFNNNTFHISM